ncbi:hypothetical protein OGAPHI_005320 [Ogataea philodendri]|uniref:Golgi apparatus membrane protein TVP23 n=1 Tax=Ogataea philodendri TaxID=1378263 RepID=A0A9P8P116_9ASCO|nr:uncharacterized protein OGAPHI_005320 [Ogataea philodendri]KAH3663330.1 hypothetical protein OGAPHI_005320 [Ogataea philodendri]
MYYVGIDTDKKFNVPGFWPDPDTLNKIPKEPYEIQAELARMNAARAEKRRRLEEKAAELAYLFGLLFTSNYILNFIVIMLLLASDFWNVKNIAGRLMVGLRWWNEANELGQSVWVFETADPNRYINPIDSKVFWTLLYTTPFLWLVLGFVAALKFQFLTLILVVMAIVLTSINALAYTKCDKFGKANNIANDVAGSVASGLFGNVGGVFTRLFSRLPFWIRLIRSAFNHSAAVLPCRRTSSMFGSFSTTRIRVSITFRTALPYLSLDIRTS